MCASARGRDIRDILKEYWFLLSSCPGRGMSPGLSPSHQAYELLRERSTGKKANKRMERGVEIILQNYFFKR